MLVEQFRQTLADFEAAGVADPLAETLHLYDHLATGALRRAAAASERPATAEIARRRKEGTPLAYILGQAPFMGLSFFCTPHTLIPRAETELLAEQALAQIRRRAEEALVVDMGAGCGNLAVSLAYHAPGARLLASDISPEAVAVARRNVARHEVGERVTLFCGDLFAPLVDYQGRVDVVVCNPPYIPTGSLQKLDPEIREHEPALALDAGSYGIDIFRRLIGETPDMLTAGGTLLFEIGAGQEKLVTRLLQRSGAYEEITTVPDEEGIIRVIMATQKPS